MKIALAQLNYHIGNFENNISKIIKAVKKAKQNKVDIVVFAELAVSGYPPRDFLEFTDFINKCENAIQQIAKECTGISAIIGAPSKNIEGKGKNLYNSAFFIADGKIQKIIHKTLLPNYDIFDEYRYFEPNKKFELVEYKNKKIAVTICEDIWNISDVPLYTVNPMDELIKLAPDLMINISASPFHYEQPEIRREILIKNTQKYKLPLFYVSHVGAQTEMLFDGNSMALNSNGKIIDELKYFDEDFKVFDVDDIQNKKYEFQNISKIELIHEGLVMGVKNYFQKLGFQKAILGLSGGIDSAVTLVIAEKALGKENIKALLMPSKFSSEHSINDAKELAEYLGVDYEIINIENDFKSVNKTLEPYFKNLPFNIAEENIQARLRGLILMAFTNKFGYILLNTSNKSEMAVGYGTLYGDMCGGLSVLGDVYKTQVFELADFINKNKIVIPENTITKPPSAELRPNQKDSDSLPDYEILDKILFQYIEKRLSPKELINMGFDENIVRKTLKLVNTNEYKRNQAPPVLRISAKAFGMGRRMPIVGKYLS